MIRFCRLLFCFASFLLRAVAAQDPCPSLGTPLLPCRHLPPRAPKSASFRRLRTTGPIAINSRDQYGLELVLSPAVCRRLRHRRHHHAQPAGGPGDHRRRQDAAPGPAGHHRAHAGRHRRGQRHLRAAPQGRSGPVDEKGVFTHVFERVHGGWVCINSQRTSLREDDERQARSSPPPKCPSTSRCSRRATRASRG